MNDDANTVFYEWL